MSSTGSRELQNTKNSAEEVLHPGDETEQFATPADLHAAFADRSIVALPRAALAERGIAIDRGMGEFADRLGEHRTTYRGLRDAGARGCSATSARASRRSPARRRSS